MAFSTAALQVHWKRKLCRSLCRSPAAGIASARSRFCVALQRIAHCHFHRQIPLRSGVVAAAPQVDRLSQSATSNRKIWLPNVEHTVRFGHFLAEDCNPGDVLLLHGDLGAGKTAVARGYVQAARKDKNLEITSPTYLLTNVYPAERNEGPNAPPDIYHMDLWRLDSASERPIVDFEKVFTEAISLIEWPDRLKGLMPSSRLDVFLEYPSVVTPDEATADDPWGFGSGEADGPASSRSGRFVSVKPHGKRWREKVDKLYNSTSVDEEGRLVIANTFV